MPISIACPGCESGYRVPDTAAGKTIVCKKCGTKVPIAASQNGKKKKEDDKAPKKKGGSVGKILLIVGGILAFSCLLCMGVSGIGAWFIYRKTTNAWNDVIVELQKDAPIIKDGKDGIVIKDGKDAFKDAFKDFGKDFSKGFK
jgi:transcription initiation factor TFIIIB Brf1 subunit/transcription initiation factor TFIIB